MKNRIFCNILLLIVFSVGIGAQENIHWNPDIEYGSFMDSRNGYVYNTVKIGNKTWMAENFNLDFGRKGRIYGRDPSNADIYGRLYNWETARRLAPPGWHLPSKAEWQELIDFLGGKKVAGGKMKETGTAHWKKTNKDVSNESGFTALPGGVLKGGSFDILIFHYLGSDAYFWCSTKYDNHYSWYLSLPSNGSEIFQSYHYKYFGCSVRYVKD
ncbi:hypothetical protein BVY01_02970 [bacterium I07]|nr:hypothetical protein BVY01_02970 [bacterium I07]